ncbi:MOSC domain-containing protein [Bdellovibrio bacteriovorus]|nr:MOSC N-terminal beta barrel domain-containing protein [Bdellovibrio bacteriovorus]
MSLKGAFSIQSACSKIKKDLDLGSGTRKHFVMKVQELHIYPIKSARGQKVKNFEMTEQGPVGDRQWMLIDDKGSFLSQRGFPKMATIETFYEPEALTVGLGKMFFKISTKNNFQRKATVQVWNDSFEAALEPDLYSQGIAQYLGTSCRLVRYAPYSQRRVRSNDEGNWSPEVRFADGRPLLLTSQKSLEDLNSRLSVPVPMNRFRPNIVVDGAKAYEEDQWKKIKIGSVILSQPKASIRCVIINIDQTTGESRGPDPLKTLASYRRIERGVSFGVLWIPENTGIISENDAVEVLE